MRLVLLFTSYCPLILLLFTCPFLARAGHALALARPAPLLDIRRAWQVTRLFSGFPALPKKD
jgi:hypothetical protein